MKYSGKCLGTFENYNTNFILENKHKPKLMWKCLRELMPGKIKVTPKGLSIAEDTILTVDERETDIIKHPNGVDDTLEDKKEHTKRRKTCTKQELNDMIEDQLIKGYGLKGEIKDRYRNEQKLKVQVKDLEAERDAALAQI